MEYLVITFIFLEIHFKIIYSNDIKKRIIHLYAN